jgi:hypothetical protein
MTSLVELARIQGVAWSGFVAAGSLALDASAQPRSDGLVFPPSIMVASRPLNQRLVLGDFA